MATQSSNLACKFRRQRSLAGYSPWDHKESGNYLSNYYSYVKSLE